MTELFASGHVIDAIMALTLLECIVIVTYRARTGHGPALAPFVVNLLSGFCLMAALRCALTGVWWGWISLCLIGSLTAHLAELAWTWTDCKPS